MNQCLRCNQPCSATSLFCDDCRSIVQEEQGDVERDAVGVNSVQHGRNGRRVHGLVAPLLGLPSMAKETLIAATKPLSDYDTAPLPSAKMLASTPPPLAPDNVSGVSGRGNIVEQAMHRLSEAAQRIADAEPGSSRGLRASRLRPLRDISSDIQRHSTPLPKTASGQLHHKSEEDLSKRMPDLWPWLQDSDSDERAVAQWANYTDPLLARPAPSRQEAARIAAEDMRQAMAQGLVAMPARAKRTRVHQLRLAFICFAVLAVLALGIDSVLLSVVFLHTAHPVAKVSGPPTLTISLPGQAKLSNVVSLGQSLDLHLQHFTPSSFVFLTHDVGELVQTNLGTPLFRVDQNGDAKVTTVIDDSWQPGFHTLQAEDRAKHYTASATLQITSGRTRPSHLQVKSTMLDMGALPQGANTIQALTLYNSGTGSITWSANSDQPWLMLTPAQGAFSDTQTIAVGVERATLAPKDYTGTITFSSNVGDHVNVQVKMGVLQVQANTPVLAITPAVLSFSALDGGPNPNSQYLMMSNPGSHTLHWSLSNNSPTALNGQSTFFSSLSQNTNWLTLNQASGDIAAGKATIITVAANSTALLPGTYINTLVFTGNQGTINSPQNVTISLTVEPSCGLIVNTGGLSFTAVAGQTNPGNQALTLSTTPNCPNMVNWQATSSASWLTVTPLTGQVAKGVASTVMTVGVNTQGMGQGTSEGTIAITAGQNTQTVLVTLTIEPPLAPNAPVMGVSQLSLNFSTIEGQSSPPGQAITITNTAHAGGGTLFWHTAVTALASSWLGASPAYGTVAAGQTGQLTVDVSTSTLTPGSYVGQVVLTATDGNGQNAGGSPQTVMVNLTVLPPCTLAQPSSSALVFNASQGGMAPSPQSLTLTASGNCNWPLTWQAHVPNSASWLSVSPASGTLSASGQSVTLMVSPAIANLNAGNLSTVVTLTATDASNVLAQGSPQNFTVTLNMTQPCDLQVSPTAGFAFTMTQGQAPAPQTLMLSETGSCARPVAWMVNGDNNSSGWLSISNPAGADTGSGSKVSVGINPSATLTPGTYNGSITVSATDANGVAIQSSPQTIPVLLTVTGFTLSGSVNACAATPCTTSAPLAGATLTLVNSGGAKIATITANGNGNFSFTNVPAGSYTLSAMGTDSSGNSYAGTMTLTVTANATNLTVNTFINTSNSQGGGTPTSTP